MAAPVRIALTYPEINLVGGVERVVVECANHLARGGHEVTVYASRWDASVLDPAVRRTHVPVRPRPEALAALAYRRRATRLLREADHDVHASFSALSPLGGVFWTPSVHAAAVEDALARRSPAERAVVRANPYHVVRLRLEKELYAPGNYRRVIAQTEGVKADVMRFYDVPADDIDVLPLGFDPVAFDAARRERRRAEARASFGYGEDDFVVLFVGNELERKGFDTLVAAMRMVPEARLHVVGRLDPGEPLGGRGRWVGASDDVALHHAAADVFVLPTRYEPWGLVIVEALASGLPVVTSRLAGAAEVVREGEAGVLLDDPDDAGAVATGIRWAMGGGAADASAIAASVGELAWPSVLSRWEAMLR